MKVFPIAFISALLICGNSVAQKNWAVHGGVKIIDYAGTNMGNKTRLNY